MREKLTERKPARLKGYDYSTVGTYFITICTKNRLEILGKLRKNVGVALLGDPQNKIILTREGKIVKKHIENCNIKFNNIFID